MDNQTHTADLPINSEAFGKADSALSKTPFDEYLTAVLMDEGEYYRPTISFKGLAKLPRVNPQHSRLPSMVANWVVKYMAPNKLISREALRRAVIEYNGIGNGFIRINRTRGGGVYGTEHLPALRVRRMKNLAQYGWLDDDNAIKPYNVGEVVHIYEYDMLQEVYGVPFWIGALQSILLGEEIRLFPRRFFGNGAHAKKMIVTTGLGPEDRKSIDKQIQGTINGGQFKTIMAHMNKGEVEKLIKVIDFAADASKIEYNKLAEMTGTDVLEAWGIPPELAGQMPDGTGTSRDLDKIERVFHSTMIVPIQQLFADALNPHLPINSQLVFIDPYADDDDDDDDE